jgi:hypothetical protein
MASYSRLELLELILAGVFLLVGGAKLIGRPDMVALFRDIGLGQWFRYVTGTMEVAGAALLVLPRLSGGSAIAVGAVRIIASFIELFVLHRPSGGCAGLSHRGTASSRGHACRNAIDHGSAPIARGITRASSQRVR